MYSMFHHHAVWDYVDAGVAYVFGLDESKYQWAIDRHNQQLAQVSQHMHNRHASDLLVSVISANHHAATMQRFLLPAQSTC